MTPGYAPVVLEHWRRPRNRGPLAEPHASHEGSSPLCGDRVRMELRFDGEVVSEARFGGDACAIATAAASLLTEHLRRRSVRDIQALTPADVLALLGVEVPAARLGCVRLPLDVVQGALRAWRPADRTP